MDSILLLIFAASLLYMIFKWGTKNFDAFEKRGVPFVKPRPFVGNTSFAFCNSNASFHRNNLDLYNQTNHHKIFGMFNMRDPLFFINDPFLVKTMATTDADVFVNHSQVFNTRSEPILGHMLNLMQGLRWRNMRNVLIPVFTASKLRAMFPLMEPIFVEGLKQLHRQPTGEFDLEMKDFFSRLANDLIASTAFGVDVNSFEDPENAFFKSRHNPAKMSLWLWIKMGLCRHIPILSKYLSLCMFEKKKIDYFVGLIEETMKYREEHKIRRPDILHVLMEAKKDRSLDWSDNELVAQCFIFLFAAFENITSLLGTACHELMENPRVQRKLYEEVEALRDNLKGEPLSYDSLKDMQYLDLVLMETLRKWPLVPTTDRVCSRDYTVRDEEGHRVCELRAGDVVWFHIMAMHWDAEYFEEPAAFRPERFSEQSKASIRPFTYIPFGLGSRSCLGYRYALIPAKAILFYMLRDFELLRSRKTCGNLLQDIRGMQMTPKGGYWLKLQKR